MNFLNTFVAQTLVFFHDLVGPLTGLNTGLSWALAIVILSLLIRLALLPLNIGQFHAQMKMTKFQPELQALNKKFKKSKADLEKSLLGPEERKRRMLALQTAHMNDVRSTQKKHNFKFSRLIVPIVVQMVIGISLFQVITSLRPGVDARYGLSEAVFSSAAEATVFGAPLATRLFSSGESILAVDGNVLIARIAILVLVLLAVFVTTISIRQSLRRSPAPDPATFVQNPRSPEEIMQRQMQDIQLLMRTKGILILPAFFLLAYTFLPLGVLLNIAVIATWAATFQLIMYRRHPSLIGLAESETPDGKSTPVVPDGSTATESGSSEKRTQRAQPKRKKRR